MIIKEKELEINKFILKTHLNIFVSNLFLTMKIMNFEILSLTKVIHFFVIYSMHALYKEIYNKK